MKLESHTGTKLDNYAWSLVANVIHHFGTSPSAPLPNLRFSRDATKARTTLHARMEAHRNLHACSTRGRSRRKICVSMDQRPPTSPVRTTIRARARGPMSSGYVRSFLRRATVRTAPSICAAPGLADPSQWSGETSVVSTASCIPPKKEGQTIRDNFQSAAVVSMRQTQIHVPHHHVHRQVTSSLSANSGAALDLGQFDLGQLVYPS